jgi:hypothetical protein
MNERLDDIIRLFRIPGFHHQKFKDEFKVLADLSKGALSSELHKLCIAYDKSEQHSFSQFKTRLRRYLFNRKGNKVLVISTFNLERLREIKQSEDFSSDDEVIDALLFYYRKMVKDEAK